MRESFDTVVVGTGFASSFFLREYLRHAAPQTRVLVLEKGRKFSYPWKMQHMSNTDFDFESAVVNLTPSKSWVQNIAFGGGSCWTGTSPRPHPSDFEMKRRYGVGEDWPLSYDDLEPYLTEVEYTMGINGSNAGPFPRSRPYPTPAHTLNGFDEAIAKKYPDQHIPMPSARSSSTLTGRPVCCVNGICSTCPIASKFQVDLHMADLYGDPRVTLRLESGVDQLDVQGDRVQGGALQPRGSISLGGMRSGGGRCARHLFPLHFAALWLSRPRSRPLLARAIRGGRSAQLERAR